MKKLFEMYADITPHVRLYLRCAAAFLLALLTLSAASGIIADSTPYYYELEALSRDLVLALRPCTAIAGLGAIALQWLEKSEPKT